MAAGERCSVCGATLSPAMRGLCGKCLVRLALAEEDGPRDRGDRAEPSTLETLERVGPYRILERLGEGGMGVVFKAEQRRPVRRTVALKLIRLGMDTERIVARFESERQALALMDHPAIARVFDAGATEQGRPYFVMEYVRGEPISLYCDLNRLSTVERLELFARVCEGVHHAHQKGIIHRDIKSSNVLVTEQDGRPVPKIIDFGVAKATQQRLTDLSNLTQIGSMVGTPEYMSPEQAGSSAPDVDTRTDVYSLGVLLYELLVGALPFDPDELRRGTYDEMCRRIREEEPPRPSSRLGTLGNVSEEAARRRGADRRALVRQLRGDLDWITMKALSKERGRRYASAHEFAEDVRRHLNHHPVAASPPGLRYRSGKFIRRHRLGVAAAALVVSALAVGLVGTVYGLVRATDAEATALQEATTAERVSEFLVGLFEVSDPGEGLGERVTARELLDQGTARIDAELADQPEVQARLTHTMGRVYRGLGLYERAEALLETALEARRESLGEDHPTTIESIHELGELRARQSRYEEAERLLRHVVDFREGTLGSEDPATLRSKVTLARSYLYEGRFDEAESLLTATLATQGRTLGPEDTETLGTATWLAEVYIHQGRYEDAVSLLVESLEGYGRALGGEHPQTLLCEYLLADAYVALGDYGQAESLFLHNLEARDLVLGPDHPDTVTTKGVLAKLYVRMDRLAEAEAPLREVLELRRRVFGTDHRKTVYSMTALGYVYKLLGRLDEAEALTKEALDTASRVLDSRHPQNFHLMHNLGEILAAQGRVEEAEALFLETLRARRDTLGEDHPDTAETLYMLANLRRDAGRHEEACRLYEEAMGVLEKNVGPDHFRVVQIRNDHVELKRQLGTTRD